MKSIVRIVLVMVTCTLTLAPMAAVAQVDWLNPESRQGFQFEFTAGSFEQIYWYDDLGEKFPFPTSSIFVTVRGRFSPSVSGVCELPYFISKREWTFGYTQPEPYTETRSGIANPYFGVEFGREGTSPLWNLGVRLPVISAEHMEWAGTSQFISPNRFLAYLNKVIQISSNWGYRYIDRSGFGLRTTFGGQLGIPDRGDAELFLDLGTSFWYRTTKARFMAAFSSLYLVTEDNVDFANRHFTSISFSADLLFGQVEPGIHVGLPIGENLTEVINNTYGVHVAYHFSTPELGR